MNKELNNSYEEIMNALAFYFSDGELKPSTDQIYKEIKEDFDPITTIANALDDYRTCKMEKSNAT